MKVLCFIDGLGSGGAQRQMVNLAIGLKQRHHDVELMIYEDDMFYEPKLISYDIPIHKIDNTSYLKRVINSRKFIRRFKPDMVISFLEVPNFIACIASIGNHSWKLITSERNAKEYEFTNKRGRILKWFERFSDWTVCNSNVAQTLWKKYYPQYQNRVSTIYNAVQIGADSSNSTTNDKNSGKKRVVIAASYQGLKNPIGVIEAINKLSDTDKEHLRVDWFGNTNEGGTNKTFLEACSLVEKYGLQSVVYLNGPTTEIYKEMNNSDVIALCSYVEGLPNVICEGMFLGKPIIMSRVSDYETFVTTRNGLLCNAEDPDSIAGAFHKVIICTEHELKDMGEKSKQLATELFDFDRYIDQWEKLIYKICKERR